MTRTEERCPICGARGEVREMAYNAFVARCSDCYEGDPEAEAWRHLQGIATDPDEAIARWLERAREYAAVCEVPPLVISYEPRSTIAALAWQIAQESARQRGWFRRCAGTGNAPETCPRGGELLYGPAFSPTWPDTAEAEWAS